MKTLNERKLIQEEINRINELIGNKQIITEQSQFFKNVIDNLGDELGEFLGKAVKQRDEDVWLVGGQRVSKSTLEALEIVARDPDYWTTLNSADKKLIAAIMRSDEKYVEKVFDSLTDEFDDILTTQEGFLSNIMKVKEKTGKTTQQVLEDMWAEYPEYNTYLATLLSKKIDNMAAALPEMIKRARKPNYWIELFSDYEPQFMKFLRQSFIDGNFKKAATIVNELEKELDTISYKLVGEKGVRGKISENVQTIVNKLAALKFSSRTEVEKAFRKFLTDNKILKSSAEAEEILNDPKIKQLLDDKAKSIAKSLWLPVASKWKAWVEVLHLINPYAYWKTFIFKDPELLSTGARRFGNTVLWKDPQGWEEIRRSYFRSGVAGKVIDKTLGLILVNFGIIPILGGLFDTAMENEDVKDNVKTYNMLKDLCKDDGLPPEMCTEINNMQTEYMTEKDLDDYIWKRMPVGVDKGWGNLLAGTYVDDIITSAWSLGKRLATGGETAEEDFINSFSDLINKNRKALEDIGWDFSKTPQENADKILLTANERKENKKKVSETPEGFKAWTALNGYTIKTPYDQKVGIGIAYKNDDKTQTPINFEWDFEKNNTFKPIISITPP
jgi:hypothetical protein